MHGAVVVVVPVPCPRVVEVVVVLGQGGRTNVVVGPVPIVVGAKHGAVVVVVPVPCPRVVEVVVVLGQGGRTNVVVGPVPIVVVGPVPVVLVVVAGLVVVVGDEMVVVVVGDEVVVVVVPDGGPPGQPNDRNSDVKTAVTAGKPTNAAWMDVTTWQRVCRMDASSWLTATWASTACEVATAGCPSSSPALTATTANGVRQDLADAVLCPFEPMRPPAPRMDHPSLPSPTPWVTADSRWGRGLAPPSHRSRARPVPLPRHTRQRRTGSLTPTMPGPSRAGSRSRSAGRSVSFAAGDTVRRGPAAPREEPACLKEWVSSTSRSSKRSTIRG